jgi:hypothetical protein
MKIAPLISWSRLLPLLGLVVCAASSSFGRTIITNNGFTQNNQPIPDTSGGVSTYGSYASALNTSSNWTISQGISGIVGTPDIELIWDTGIYETYLNWDGRGNVVQLDSHTQNASTVFNIYLLPSGSAAVSLESFDLDAWSGTPGGIDIVADWSLTNLDGTAVYSSGVFTKPGVSGGRSTLTTNYTGAIGEGLVLRINQIQGDGAYLALDNLTYDQVSAVPEPSTMAFLMISLAVAVSIVGRRRRISLVN